MRILIYLYNELALGIISESLMFVILGLLLVIDNNNYYNKNTIIEIIIVFDSAILDPDWPTST